MWICLNDAFISVVRLPWPSQDMQVRARRKAHLVKLFPNDKVRYTPKNDYHWRVIVSEDQIAELVASRIRGINYDNFKDSVKEPRLKGMYGTWWQDHHRYQTNDRRQ